MVPTASDDALSVRGKLNSHYWCGVALKHRQQAAIQAVPNSGCMIMASGNNSLSIRGKLGAGEHPIGVGSQHPQQAAIRAAPDSRCIIRADGDDAPAIGGK